MEKEIIEKNRVIAEFMGLAKEGDCYLSIKHDFVGTPNYLKYHTSWDWLMQVVEKIESMGHCVDIYNKVCIIPHLKKCIADTKIKAVYAAVTQFIQWYNSNTPNHESTN